jgi:hypothetical protein
MVRMCERVQALPSAGGVLDQDAMYIFFWQHVMALDEERAKLNKIREGNTAPKR